jgi:cytochrome c oxidase cbb3-type subunit 3
MPRWWWWMFVLSIVFGLGYLVLYPGLGTWQGTLDWSGEKEFQAKLEKITAGRQQKLLELSAPALEDIAKNPEARTIGASLFSQHCAGCHGITAQGAVGFPNLVDNDWLYGGDPETILSSITKGRTGGMPPFKAMLSQGDIDTVAAFIQQWPSAPKPGAEQTGEKLFSQRCSYCHGKAGEGNYALGAPTLNDEIWLYGGTRSTVVRSITHGRSGKMPAHENLMSGEELRIVAAWVYSQSQPIAAQ